MGCIPQAQGVADAGGSSSPSAAMFVLCSVSVRAHVLISDFAAVAQPFRTTTVLTFTRVFYLGFILVLVDGNALS